jgi:hypothetical protein
LSFAPAHAFFPTLILASFGFGSAAGRAPHRFAKLGLGSRDGDRAARAASRGISSLGETTTNAARSMIAIASHHVVASPCALTSRASFDPRAARARAFI